MPGTSGTIRLFKFAGINVYLHWSWFLVAAYAIQRKGRYSSISWTILEYLALFAIVTLHEFGHALACRRVGGRADQIVLWPLGGIAYVIPPSRPGANLWSIAAGPLVNLALMPVLGLIWLSLPAASDVVTSNFSIFIRELNVINIGLFLFNVLPIYPLDGGKILRSLLWYIIGRARSLMATVIVGFIGVGGLALLAFFSQSLWLAILAAFAGIQCANGFKQAQQLKRLENLPRRNDRSCPACNANPPLGAFWACGLCSTSFDTFEVNAKCPKCSTLFPKTTCTECGEQSAFSDWVRPVTSAAAAEPPALRTESSIAAPSVIPVVLGVTFSLAAIAVLFISLLFMKLSSDQLARQPAYRAEIDTLWQSDGMAIPGRQTLTLRRGERYDAYIESNVTDSTSNSSIDIRVINVESGTPVLLTHPRNVRPLQHNEMKMSPAVSFLAPVSGRYTVESRPGAAGASIARIKVGPSLSLVNGTNAAAGRGLAVVAGVFAVALIGVAVLLFVLYGRRRRDFNTMLQRMRVTNRMAF